MTKILIKGGRAVDPASPLDGKRDILIEEGEIRAIEEEIRCEEPEVRVIEAEGKIVTPGLIDIHTHLREPGREDEETIATGSAAAAKGGFTTILCMPNTEPPIDNHSLVKFIIDKSRTEAVGNVLPVGSISKGLEGESLSEIGQMVKGGAVAISDDGYPVINTELMRRALEYTRIFDIPVISHCEDTNLSKDGVMNEGYVSTILGMRGIPRAAEEVMVAREIILAELTGTKVHIAHVSTKGSLAMIKEAKRRGLKVTCEVTPHHLILTDEVVMGFDTNTRVNPPLRGREDVDALREGLAEGIIDAIATDHAPHALNEKELEYGLAPCGIVGLETALGLLLTEIVNKGVVSFFDLIAKLTIGPARILNLERGRLKVGSPADVIIIDPREEWVVDPSRFVSKSKNTPFNGWQLKGKTVVTIINGRIAVENGELV
ncbi:TPA: dihydroorotase [bacterium]|nr:dihydroorotase [bacterium]